MQRIQQLSSRFSFLFVFLMVLIPSLAMMYWLFFPFFRDLGVQFSNTPLELMVDTLPSRCAAFAVTLLPVINIMIGLHWLHRLFKNFAHGLVFCISNVRIYRNIGLSLFCLSLTDNLFETLMTWVMTYNKIGGPILSLGIDTAQIIYIAIGSLIWLTSYVMQEAYELDHDAQLTI